VSRSLEMIPDARRNHPDALENDPESSSEVIPDPRQKQTRLSFRNDFVLFVPFVANKTFVPFVAKIKA